MEDWEKIMQFRNRKYKKVLNLGLQFLNLKRKLSNLDLFLNQLHSKRNLELRFRYIILIIFKRCQVIS